LALKTDGQLWAWGANADGQIGTGATGQSVQPAQVPGWVTPTSTPPAAPTKLTATPISSSKTRLIWKDNSDNETGFRIERRVGSGAWTWMANVGANVTTTPSRNLVSGATYSYRIRALNEVGFSAYSNVAKATNP
jgi:hypothetical protein